MNSDGPFNFFIFLLISMHHVNTKIIFLISFKKKLIDIYYEFHRYSLCSKILTFLNLGQELPRGHKNL